MAPADRKEITQALNRISDETWTTADKAIQKVQADVSLAGRVASNSHNVMLTDAASEAYKAGTAKMIQQVRSYTGVTASDYSDLLADVLDRLTGRLVEAHKSRLNALAHGKYPGVKNHMDLFMGNFTRPLIAARDAGVSELAHTLYDPEDALPWWRRTRTKDHVVGFIAGVVATLVAAGLSKVLGL